MWRANIALFGGLLLLATRSRADQNDPLAHADVISEIGLARLADEAGDGTLAGWLKRSDRRELQLVALRAMPYAFEPERLVPHVAPLLCGRDPNLAPEAALALMHVAERLRPSELENREATRGAFREAQKALACIKEQSAPVRADLVSAALVLDSVLAQL